ncbi:MAG: hypothetical protein ACKO5Q_21225, partial [Microcystaceae cyanobacterium]
MQPLHRLSRVTLPYFALGLGLSLSLAVAPRSQAAEPNTAPPQLTNLLSKFDTVANQRNLDQL